MRSLIVVAAAMLVVACGGGSNSSSSSSSSSPTSNPTKAAMYSSVDACKLVTADDASTAVATAVTNAAGSVAIPGACFYTSQDGQTGVMVFAQTYPDASTADQVDPNQIAAGFASIYGVKDAHSVSGIGDKAFEYTATSSQSNSSGMAIFVFKANALIFIVMSPATDSSKIEALAKTAVSRL